MRCRAASRDGGSSHHESSVASACPPQFSTILSVTSSRFYTSQELCHQARTGRGPGMEPPMATNANRVGAPRAVLALGAAGAAAPCKGTPDVQPLWREGICGATGTPNAPACGVGLVTCEGC